MCETVVPCLKMLSSARMLHLQHIFSHLIRLLHRDPTYFVTTPPVRTSQEAFNSGVPYFSDRKHAKEIFQLVNGENSTRAVAKLVEHDTHVTFYRSMKISKTQRIVRQFADRPNISLSILRLRTPLYM